MGWTTKRKIQQTIDALQTAHEAGQALRIIMGNFGMLEEALKQSELEERLSDTTKEMLQAWHAGNLKDGAGSVWASATIGSNFAEGIASHWSFEKLENKVPMADKDAFAQTLVYVSNQFKGAAIAFDDVAKSL